VTGIAAALLAATLTGSSTYSVAVIRRVGIEPDAGLNLAEIFSLALQPSPKVAGQWVTPRAFAAAIAAERSDSATCAGSIDCAVALGRAGGIDWLVAVQVVRVGTKAVFDASLVRVADGTPVASASATVPLKSPVQALEQLSRALLANAPEAADAAPSPGSAASVPEERPTSTPPPPTSVFSRTETPSESTPSSPPEEPGKAIASSPQEASAAAGESQPAAKQQQTGLVAGALVISDVLSPSLGAEGYGGISNREIEVSARLRLGTFIGIGALGAYDLIFREATVFCGARIDDYPRAGVVGIGIVAGARRLLAVGVSATGSVSAEAFVVGDTGLHSFGLVLSLGADWRQSL
jgi:hypothetical protein